MSKNFDINTLVRPNVAKLTPYSSARDEFTDFEKDMVFLDANENPFNSDANRYPDPHQVNLKQHLSSVKRVPVDQILLGNGSDEILDLIYRAFLEPGEDAIITTPPTYGMYSVLANINNVEDKKVLLTSDFQLDVDGILAAANEKTKLLLLCSPNNPSGNLLNQADIERLLNEFNGLVLIDEAYIDFAKAESWSTRLQDFPNLIISQTLSKAYGLAGIRLGICYASAEIIAVLNKIKPPYNVNSLTQTRALQRVLKQAEVEQEVKTILEERDALMAELEKLDIVSKVFPSDSNSILLRVDDANKRYAEFIELGVVVRNRSSQPHCENCLRITVGTPEENKKLIEAFKKLS
ncbi:MAG: histidinol-phosphate transaminase [Cytophagaceae bacterium]|nr:histidinol-phosphate transaminase [Cytophagaceae bacterium]|tara:strand:- start:3848 stop:4897 length:1050 start_codon:yes stop_codon:yes gene_type:complete